MPIQTASQAYTNEGIGGFSFRNKIINGAMEIDQRNAGSAVTISDQFTLDRWSAYENTDGTFTVQRSTDAPTGFANSLLASITSADSSLSTSQQIIPCRQWLEGTIIRDLAWGTANAKPITVSFWVKSSITGTYGFTISNDAGDRVYGQTYTINAAGTWEYKTATISGPTGGTWPTTTGRGAIITWSLGAGSGVTIASNGSWITPASASATYAVVGQTNVGATNGASWYITGVQLETGSVATPFELRPFGTELQLCERYCLQFTSTTYGNPLGGIGIFLNGSASAIFGGRFRMRAAPTATYTGAGPYIADAAGGLSTVSSVSVVATGANSFVEWQFNFPAMGGGAYGGKSCYFISNIGSYLRLDAEL